MSNTLISSLRARSVDWLNESDLHAGFDPDDTAQSAEPLISHAIAGIDVLNGMAEHDNTVHHIWYSLNDNAQRLKERDADEDTVRHDWAALYPDIVQAVHDSTILIGL